MSDDEPRPDDEPRRPVGARFRRPASRPRPEGPAGRPAAPDPGAGDPPTFALVRWGYDPVQVDARLHALGTQVTALRAEVRQLRSERDEAERSAGAPRTTAVPGRPGAGPGDAELRDTRLSGGGDRDVEDKIARVARHEAARRRVGGLTDATGRRDRD